jgi:hypothetical protein
MSAAARAPVLKVGPRDGDRLPVTRDLAEDHDAVHVRVRIRAQHHCVDDTEDRGRRADAERQGQHDDGGEARVLAERPQREAHVARDRVHRTRRHRRQLVDVARQPAHRLAVADATGAQRVVLVVEMLAHFFTDPARPLRHVQPP